MNIQQLEYIIAVDTHRHFVNAAEACFVTQATLSMMIKKLEEEMGIVIFDRSKQPVVPTQIGKQVIEQAKVILREVQVMKQLTSDTKGSVSGEIRIGVIPTVAPYLLPLFLKEFLKNYPEVKVIINERTTNQIIDQLSHDTLDVGILATPLKLDGIREEFLYYEKFLVYVSEKERNLSNRKFLLSKDIDVNKMWMLEEGHCMRMQMLKVCELNKESKENKNLIYETGSVESLIRLVDTNGGYTILPELATSHFTKKKLRQLKEFKSPEPVREISLVTYRHFVKKTIFEALKTEIVAGVKKVILDLPTKKDIIGIYQ